MPSITESCSDITYNIDIQDSQDISKLIFECEKQIYGGYSYFGGILEDEILEKCVLLTTEIKNTILLKDSATLVLIGAGTSGRLCRLISQMISDTTQGRLTIIPIIAGGIKALIKAEPNTEDQFDQGFNDFISYTQNIDRSNTHIIGITCGLSANYVIGGIRACLKYSPLSHAIIGFNHVSQAKIDLAIKDEDVGKLIIINPIIGPEPIIGSVRMKGGTATLILLYSIINSIFSDNIRSKIREHINKSQISLQQFVSYSSSIGKFIEIGGNTLKCKGRIFLIGSELTGSLCVYDAAECPPTFGAYPHQINGYTINGINDLVAFEHELNTLLPIDISYEGFKKIALGNFNSSDLVIFILSNESIPKLDVLNIAKNNNMQVGVILINSKDQEFKSLLKSNLNTMLLDITTNFNHDFHAVLLVRTFLTQFSTGSFIHFGKVFNNKMIDLRITNKKLLKRAIQITKEITCEQDEELILKKLLGVIYEEDKLSMRLNDIYEHISIASNKEHILPKTILSIMHPNYSFSKINKLIATEPIIRKLVKNCI